MLQAYRVVKRIHVAGRPLLIRRGAVRPEVCACALGVVVHVVFELPDEARALGRGYLLHVAVQMCDAVINARRLHGDSGGAGVNGVRIRAAHVEDALSVLPDVISGTIYWNGR